MNNRYEERLGTDRMLPLVFRMALPAVAAQFVNLLYNIVDRIYIGHIPGIGTEALAGVGVTTSIVILISSFSSIVGAGGAPLAAMALGQGDRERAGRILGKRFCDAYSFHYHHLADSLYFYGAYSSAYRSVRKNAAVCRRLSFCLSAWYAFRGDIHRA